MKLWLSLLAVAVLVAVPALAFKKSSSNSDNDVSESTETDKISTTEKNATSTTETDKISTNEKNAVSTTETDRISTTETNAASTTETTEQEYTTRSNSMTDRNNSAVSRAFRNAGIIPDILSRAPLSIARVYYQRNDVCLGEELRVTEVLYRPTLSYRIEPGVNYTVFLLSLDEPSEVAPAFRSVIYWMIVNVPGTNISAGYEVQGYVPPLQYAGSGCHRYVFLVYAQNSLLDTTNRNLLRLGAEAFDFTLSNFVERYDIGELVAGSFFRTCMPNYRKEFYCM